MRSGWRANLLVAACGFAVSLVFAEAAVRIYLVTRLGPSILWYGTRYNRHEIKGMREREQWAAAGDPRALRGAGDERHSVRFHRNQAVSYSKFLPGEVRHTYDVDTSELIPVTINRHGFRGKDFDIVKRPDTIRIVTLGASSTFGYHDRDDQTYPYYLEQRLQELCSPRRFEVINLGVPHLTSKEILELFRAEGVPLRPDVVTFYEGINDSSFDKPKPKSLARRTLAAVHRWIRERLVTVAFAEEVLFSTKRTFSAAAFERHRRGRSEQFLRHLSDLLEECRASGAMLIVANQQARSLLVPRHQLSGITYQQEVELVRGKLRRENAIETKELNFLTHADLMRDLEAWARVHAVPFVDVIGALDARRDVLVSWVHLNAEGNRLIAGALAEEIKARICDRDRDAPRTAAVATVGVSR